MVAVLRGLGGTVVILVCEVILPRVGLYSAAEHIITRYYGRLCQPDYRERALADVYERSGRIDEAEESLKRAVALRPNAVANYLFLGQFLARHNRTSEAVHTLEEALVCGDDSPVQLEFARKRLAELRQSP